MAPIRFQMSCNGIPKSWHWKPKACQNNQKAWQWNPKAWHNFIQPMTASLIAGSLQDHLVPQIMVFSYWIVSSIYVRCLWRRRFSLPTDHYSKETAYINATVCSYLFLVILLLIGCAHIQADTETDTHKQKQVVWMVVFVLHLFKA